MSPCCKHVEFEESLKVDGRYRKIDEMPFDFERRRMSVVLGRDDGAHILICKGAVEEVFAACTRYAVGSETGPFWTRATSPRPRRRRPSSMPTGFRVVAVAYKEMPPAQATYSVADEAELTLLGYIAFLDPPKETAAAGHRGSEGQRRAGEDSHR